MKRVNLLVLSLVIFLATSCNMPEPKELGAKFEENNPISIDDLIAQLQTTPLIKAVQLKGEINKSCLSEGCWFTIKDKNGESYTIDVRDKKFRLPNSSAGKTVVALLDAKIDTTQDEPEIILETIGIKYLDENSSTQ